VSESHDDLLWTAYLGLRAVKATCEIERVWGGAKAADRILDKIEEAHPEFVQRRKNLLPAGSPP